ncbi:MAG: translation initiation factor IF-2 subunit gamma [Nanoarchaeota archaeon]|nr:translation initiation factor IF-2 subunit gamma [Nanoarchaeota archaeon]
MKAQSEFNIGLVGHVDHGKTTLVKALSGKWTDTHSEEIKRGITIRLGYADASFYHCKKCDFFTVKDKCTKCKVKAEFLRKVSFVDAPGHESLMATMLSGATLMDAALLLIAANEYCPQPQTREHLMALQIIGIKKVIVVQNKIDTVTKEEAMQNHKEIKKFLKGTQYEKASIIPVSAQHSANLDILIRTIQAEFPTPKRDDKKTPILLIARSFDTNKPGILLDSITGGVLGGSLRQGHLKVGDDIELRPGRIMTEKNQRVWKPIKTKVIGLMTGGEGSKDIGPGGSVGVMTQLDPSIVKSDNLAGNIAGIPGKLPPVWDRFRMESHLLERVVGSKEDLVVEPIKLGEPLMLNVNSAATVGVVVDMGRKGILCRLKLPICAEKESRVTISRRIGDRFRLIGYGIIKE